MAGGAGFLFVLAAPRLVPVPSAVGWASVLAAVAVAIFGRRRLRGAGAVAAALAAFGLAVLFAGGLAAMPAAARRTFAVTVLMACWWISVAIPIPATSLLPLVLFPVLGVLPSGKTAVVYANNNIFLFMGGFVLALGMERWGVHRRIALHIVRVVGTNPSRMVLGFMVATAFLSMWISNTATTLMMLPIALAVIGSLGELGAGRAAFAPALLLGIAYAASIGGLATPIGTPPNISFLRILRINFPDAPELTFGKWFLAFLPLAAAFLPAAWLVLTRVTHRVGGGGVGAGREVVRNELAGLGRTSPAERRMLLVFGVTALLWIFRHPIEIGSFAIPGWSTLLERWIGPPFAAGNLHDATVGMAMAILTFLLPGDPDDEGNPRPLMDWPTARRLPWGILLLFGGGFALATAFSESGLSRYLGEAFAARIRGASPVLLVGSTSGLLTFLTEVTSNTATTEVMLPVLGGTASAMSVNPLLLMLPATLSASCAFMLPIATPPNAIVFGSGKVEMRDMVKAGVVLNLIGILLVTAVFFLISAPVLGVDPFHSPAWAVR